MYELTYELSIYVEHINNLYVPLILSDGLL